MVYLFSFGDFQHPHGISINPRGDIYVADTGNNKLKVFSVRGDSLREIGGYGWGALEFDQPHDVDATTGLNIYVADYGNHRVQRFDKDLNYISTLFTRDDDDPDKRFGYPTSVSISRLGDLFVADGENSRILKINALGGIERNFGGIDAGLGRLLFPRQAAVSSNDIVAVLDEKRVVLFDNFGNYIRSIGQDVLDHPTGIAIHQNVLYVVEAKRILGFDIDKAGLLATYDQTTMVGQGEIKSFIDIVVAGDRFYLLTDHAVSVFEIRNL